MARLKKTEALTQFWDASVFVALLSPTDSRHKDALKIHHALEGRKVRLFTAWSLVAEAATVLLYHTGYSSAVALFKLLPAFTVFRPAEADYLDAVALFKEFNRDQKFSLNDILSYVLIRDRLPQAQVVSFDRDFIKMGLNVVTF